MTKLNQIIAIEKGIKTRVHDAVSALYKAAQKPDLFNGFAKAYSPKDSEGEKLPSENKRVQYTSDAVLRDISRTMGELFTITARKDYTNTAAKADVVVDGKVLVKGAPVSFLLFLEKQLTDVHTFINSLPILDEAEDWKKDVNSGLFKTDPIESHRTKKVQKPIVLYPATVEHPAQTSMITEDVIAGFWNQTKLSGAIQKPEKQKLLDRADALLMAVKSAREAANMTEEVKVDDVAEAIFGFILKE